jgi:hypothetical protein
MTRPRSSGRRSDHRTDVVAGIAAASDDIVVGNYLLRISD